MLLISDFKIKFEPKLGFGLQIFSQARDLEVRVSNASPGLNFSLEIWNCNFTRLNYKLVCLLMLLNNEIKNIIIMILELDSCNCSWNSQEIVSKVVHKEKVFYIFI